YGDWSSDVCSSDLFWFPALAVFSAGQGATEFRQFGRIAYLRDEPGLRTDSGYGLLLDGLADWRWPEGDRVTGLRDGDVVLASVLAEEQTLFTLEQVCQV